MPNTQSAKKRLRQNEKRRLANRGEKRAMKSQIKKVVKVAESDNTETLENELKLAISSLDRAAGRRLIHPNAAARKKAQLAKLAKLAKQAK